MFGYISYYIKGLKKIQECNALEVIGFISVWGWSQHECCVKLMGSFYRMHHQNRPPFFHHDNPFSTVPMEE